MLLRPGGRTMPSVRVFIEVNSLRFLRPYQKRAIVAIQQAVAKGSDRFLLRDGHWHRENAYGGCHHQTLSATGNARRALFLVDRLELEDQAMKAFRKLSRDRLQKRHLQREPR